MKYLSLFSGVGGFELGIGDRAECIGFSEIDKYATEIYKKHFPNHRGYGDVTQIDVQSLPEFDLLVGGFPCQSFSIAGKRKGFADTRGTLFFEIERIIREKRPRLLLLENVKGLLSHDKGHTFYRIITTLDELGYDVQWQVLNSSNWLPHSRERTYIVGHLRGTPRPEVFPIEQKSYKIEEATKKGLICLFDGDYQSHRVYSAKGFCPTLVTSGGGGHIPYIWDGDNLRQVTPIECERLQGFPDGWTEGMSDTQRYKQMGNAVTVNVIEAIMERLTKVE